MQSIFIKGNIPADVAVEGALSVAGDSVSTLASISDIYTNENIPNCIYRIFTNNGTNKVYYRYEANTEIQTKGMPLEPGQIVIEDLWDGPIYFQGEEGAEIQDIRYRILKRSV